MSLLSAVTKGKIKKPYFITIFGTSGVGKTSFAADAPNAIFACTEDGADQVDVAKFPRITNYKMLLDGINELQNSKHNFKTLVIDSIDHLEPLLWKHVCEENSWKVLEDGGFGKGYAEANKTWASLFTTLKTLREKMNVILICHAQVKNFNDPSGAAAYERYELKLHKGVNALVKENCDAILFAAYDTIVSIDKNTKRGKGYGGDTRVLFTEYRAHHDGKNRFGLPYKIDLSFKSFHDAVEASNPESAEVLCSQISGVLTKLTDEKLKEKAAEQFETAKAANDIKKLVAIKNRLMQVTQE
jgi:hypothetical protein